MGEIEFAVLDIETSGLSTEMNLILEVGCILLDRELNTVDKFESLINDDKVMKEVNRIREMATRGEDSQFQTEAEWIESAKIVWPMHIKSGLWAELATAPYVKDREQVEDEFADFLWRNGMRPADQDEGKGKEVILTGSSIHFDMDFLGAHMSTIPSYFFHRRCDASAFKVAVDKWLPETAKVRGDKLHPVKAHRAIPDCHDSVAELAFYLDHVLGIKLRENEK